LTTPRSAIRYFNDFVKYGSSTDGYATQKFSAGYAVQNFDAGIDQAVPGL
jgi:LPS-assembly protein